MSKTYRLGVVRLAAASVVVTSNSRIALGQRNVTGGGSNASNNDNKDQDEDDGRDNRKRDRDKDDESNQGNENNQGGNSSNSGNSKNRAIPTSAVPAVHPERGKPERSGQGRRRGSEQPRTGRFQQSLRTESTGISG